MSTAPAPRLLRRGPRADGRLPARHRRGAPGSRRGCSCGCLPAHGLAHSGLDRSRLGCRSRRCPRRTSTSLPPTPDRRQGADRRLACTLDAAQRALGVSADFDSPFSFISVNLTRGDSEMAVDTEMRSETRRVETRGEAPVVDDGTGTRDFIFGTSIMAGMALFVIVLGTILSLT